MAGCRPRSRPPGAPGRLPLLAAAAGALLLAAGAAMLASDPRAYAVEYTIVPEPATDGYLELGTSPGEFRVTLAPGDSAAWLIRAELEGAGTSTLALQLTGEGALVTDSDGLLVSVETCDADWPTLPGGGTGACPGTSVLVVPQTRLARAALESAGTQWRLADLTAAQARHLRLVITLPTDARVPGPGTAPRAATIGVGLFASGEDATPPLVPSGSPSASPPPLSGGMLPRTGGEPWGRLLAATGLVLAGGGLLAARARAGRWRT